MIAAQLGRCGIEVGRRPGCRRRWRVGCIRYRYPRRVGGWVARRCRRIVHDWLTLHGFEFGDARLQLSAAAAQRLDLGPQPITLALGRGEATGEIVEGSTLVAEHFAQSLIFLFERGSRRLGPSEGGLAFG